MLIKDIKDKYDLSNFKIFVLINLIYGGKGKSIANLLKVFLVPGPIPSLFELWFGERQIHLVQIHLVVFKGQFSCKIATTKC